VAAWAAPYGLIAPRRRRQEAEHRRQKAEGEAAAVSRAQAERRRLLNNLPLPTQAAVPFDHEAAIGFLVENGLSEGQVRAGSMPREALEFVGEMLVEHLPEGPLLGLHVGNFVGVSLAHLTSIMRDKDEKALVVSVDPGMPHRGIEAPDRAALRLLDRFGLTTNSLMVTGYTLGRSLRDDGYVFEEFVPPRAISEEAAATALKDDAACEQVLPNLARLLAGRFDLAVLDGNHDGEYLREELRYVDVALRPGGLLVIDDIGTTFWGGVKAAFEDLSSKEGGYIHLGNNGRVGVLARIL
jgi:hypothetical protein